jgi:alpha-mannosidase/mannosylglycerate hydrolase
MSPQQVRYILSTHWDREWYQTFQVYRQRLVQLFDLVPAELETGRLAGPFTCDGQAIILDNYLEIRPERAAAARRRLAAGDLVGGPWYVMPDEFLVSGESLIRNLRHGRNRVRALGGRPSDLAPRQIVTLRLFQPQGTA